MQIFIAQNGNQTGPFTEEQTRSMVAEGRISHDDLAWKEGVSDWHPLHRILCLSQPPPISNPALAMAAAPAATLPGDGPKGVGGWLVFYCVTLTILSPLISLGQMVGDWVQSQVAFGQFPAIKTASIWENLGVLTILVYGFIVGYMIWRGDQRGRDIVRRFLLIRLFGFVGVEIIAFLIMSGLPGEVLAGGVRGAAGAIFREVLYFAVWWSYFKISKRVRNTYGLEPV